MKRKSAKPASSRQEKATETRRRMLRAAYDLVCENGYEPTTMAAIAERANVAVQTLYFTFHTKPKILREVIHAVVVGFERWSPTLDRDVHADHRATASEAMPWMRAFESEADPRAALEIYVENTAEIFVRAGPLLANLGPQRGTEIETTLADSERLREEASAILVGMLAQKGNGLRPSLTRKQATDIFFVLTRTDLFHELTVGRGWSKARASRWLVDVLAQQLLAE